MTEGVAASCSRSRRPWRGRVALETAVALAVALGGSSWASRRWCARSRSSSRPARRARRAPRRARAYARGCGRAAIVTRVALACVAPVDGAQLRAMDRCALVSVNGGWNLLIGTQTTTGAGSRSTSPPRAARSGTRRGKDACFEREATPGTSPPRRPRGSRAPRQDRRRRSTTSARRPWYLHARERRSVRRRREGRAGRGRDDRSPCHCFCSRSWPSRAPTGAWRARALGPLRGGGRLRVRHLRLDRVRRARPGDRRARTADVAARPPSPAVRPRCSCSRRSPRTPSSSAPVATGSSSCRS